MKKFPLHLVTRSRHQVRLWRGLRFCLFLPLCLQLAAGDDKDKLPDFSNLTLQELSAIKVTSVSRTQQNLSQVAAAVYVINQEEIHRSGMTTVADLLRLVPGLSVARLDGSKWAVASRGFNGRFADKLLVLIDGRSIYSPVFSGVYWDMSMPLLDDIDRIEVIRGPGASVWGADAVSGVINIITRSAGESTGASVTAGGGTSERAFGQVRFDGKVTDRISYRGYLSGSDRSASPIGGGQNAHDGWSDEQGGFRIDGTNSNGGWQLEGDLYRNRRQEVGDLPSPQAGYVQVPANIDLTGSSSSLAFEWRRRFTETSDLRVTASYDSLNRPESGLPVAETHTGDFEIQYRFTPAKHHQVSAGLSDRVISERVVGAGLVTFTPSQLTYQVASGYAQDEIHLANDRLLLTFGAKIEHDLFAGWQLQPTARALWAPDKHRSIWIAVSKAARTPTFYERSVSAEIAYEPASPQTLGLPVVIGVNGSPQYQSEILKAYEIGYRAQPSSRFSIDLATFYDDYQHLRTEDLGTPSLFFAPQPTVLAPFVFGNNLKAKAFGGEISCIYHPLSWWKLAASYSYLDVDSRFVYNAPPNAEDADTNNVPRNQWKIQSYVNLSPKVQFDSFIFSSSTVVAANSTPTVLIPPHTRLDVRLGWRVTPRLEISLSGQDLLSSRHIELTPEALTPAGYAVRGYYLKTSWHF